jgi:hypothetical protein
VSQETKKAAWEDGYEMEEEYDFSDSAPNSYAGRFRRDTTVVLLEPDVAVKFPNSESVNEALRSLMDSNRLSRAS